MVDDFVWHAHGNAPPWPKEVPERSKVFLSHLFSAKSLVQKAFSSPPTQITLDLHDYLAI
jgi:hypothetical protein